MDKELAMKAPVLSTELNVRSLKDIAIYLSGVQEGKGNLLPLGRVDLEELWNVIAYLQGDVRYKCDTVTEVVKSQLEDNDVSEDAIEKYLKDNPHVDRRTVLDGLALAKAFKRIDG